MNIDPHILASSGSFAVGVIALFMASIQAWLYMIRREQQWHLWGMLISLATLVFAFGVFLQYFGQPDEINRIAEKLQISAIILLVHCAFCFIFSYLSLQYKRIYHLLAAVLHAVLLILVWNTELIVSDLYVYREFLLLSAPYIEPRLGWLGNFVFAYTCAAVLVLFVILIWQVKTRGSSNNLVLYMAGFLFWIVFGVHDVIVTLFNIKSLTFMMEYGFLGFSVITIMLVLKDNIEFSSLADDRARKLAREKERLEALSEVIFDYAFAFRVAPDGHFIPDWVMGPIDRITGYTAEELSDIRTRKRFIHPDDRPLMKRHTERLLQGKSETIEFRLITKSGQLKWVCDHGRSVFDPIQGRTTYIYGAVQDITERRRAEDALRENEKKYRLLVENANDAIFIVQDERIAFPNPRAFEMTGYPAGELMQLKFSKLVHPKDQDMVLKNYKNHILRRDVPPTYPFRIVTRQGQIRNVQINAVRIAWDRQPATLNFLRDITTEKKLEEQLQQKNKYEAIGILAGGMSHDINNALTSILGNLELLKLKFSKGKLDNASMDRHLVQITAAVNRVTEQCQKLLAYARGGKYQLEVIKVNALMAETLNGVRDTVPSRIRFIRELRDSLAPIRADFGQIKMVMDAVIQNAVESIRDKGSVRVSTDNVVIEKDQAPDIAPGDYVRITVIDTGIGMDAETRSKIFDPFFTTKFHGRGMSLAAVFGILKNHRGAIQVDSAPNRGTAVRIYIPSEKAGTGHAATPEPEAVPVENSGLAALSQV